MTPVTSNLLSSHQIENPVKSLHVDPKLWNKQQLYLDLGPIIIKLNYSEAGLLPMKKWLQILFLDCK